MENKWAGNQSSLTLERVSEHQKVLPFNSKKRRISRKSIHVLRLVAMETVTHVLRFGQTFSGKWELASLIVVSSEFRAQISFHQADDGQIEYLSPSSSKPASPSWIGEREIWVKFSKKTID